MANVQANTVVRYLRKLIDERPVKDLTDGQLLERFVARRDQAAFAALVQRHGGIVLGVCRHVLHHEHDAEDAFQAAFLVLARKAAEIRKGESVGSWLHSVAYRIAVRAKKNMNKRRQTESQAAARAPEKPISQVALRELQARLDEEVNRLPEKYRTPFILCCLTGKSRDEAARELGWKKGTVSSRVAKAKTLLQQRLARRGITLSAALCAGVLVADGVAAAPTSALVASTVGESLRFATGKAAGIVADQATAWAEGVLKAMAGTKLKAGAGLVLALSLFVGGAGLAAYQALSGNRPTPTAEDKGKPAARAGRVPKATADNRAPTDGNGDPLPAGAQVRLGEMRFRPGARTTHLAFSPDGKKLASWGGFLYHHDRLSLWDTATGKELRTELIEENRLAAIAWCAGGRGFAVLTGRRFGASKDFLIWEFTDDRTKNPAPPGRPGPVETVIVGPGASEYYGPFAIAPNGKWLAAYHAGGKIKPEVTLFELAPAPTVRRLKSVRTIPNLPTDVRTLAFSPDQRSLVVFSHKDPQGKTETVTVYDPATGRKKKAFPIPMALFQGTRKTFGLSPDGSLLALGLEDGTARIIDLRKGREIRSVGSHLVRGTKAPWGGVSTVAFSPDGRRLITGGRDNALKVWDVASGREVFHLAGHHSWPEATAFSGDGKRIASSGQDSLIRLWDAGTGKELVPPKGHFHTVFGLSVSRDGRRALTQAWDGTARLWDLRSGTQIDRFPQDADSPALILDDRTILTRWKGRWQLWDRTTGKQKALPVALARGRGHAFGLFENGRTLVTAEQETVTLWSWPAGKRLREIRTGIRVNKALLTPDGRTVLALSEEGGITLWDRKTGKKQGTLPVRTGWYRELMHLTDEGVLVAASITLRQLATQEDDMRIALYDVAARRMVREFSIKKTTTGVFYLLGLALSADGRTVALGHNDGTATLYEVASGQRRRALRGHRDAISALAFTPDGRLITTSLDHTALVWDVTLRGKGAGPAKPLAQAEWKGLWEELGQRPAPPAFAALAKLAGDPKAAVALVRQHLPAARGIDDATLDRIVEDLDSAQFKVRRQASRALEGFGDTVVAGVKKRLARAQSLELRLRLEAFLKKFDPAEPSAARLQEIRALQLLEELATPEARTLLGELARGNGNARRTQEAAQALKRWRQGRR